MKPMTLEYVLQSQAEATPDRLAYRFLDAHLAERATLTYRDLDDQARRLATALRAYNVQGQPVMACVGPDEHHPVALFGCFYAGATALPVYPPMPNDGGALLKAMARIAGATKAKVLVAPQTIADAIRPSLQEALGDAMPELLVIEEAVRAEAADDLPGSQPDAAAIVLFTSGSTGTPKGAIITHRGFVTNMRTLGERCGCDAEDIAVTWLPQGHIAGLYTRFLPIILGARAIVLPPSAFVANPMTWLEAMSKYAGTISAAPDFAYGLLAQLVPDEQAATLSLGQWKLAVSGGEPVRATSMDAFFAKFAPAGFRPEAFHPYYGLTETLCTSIPQGTPPVRVTASRLGIARGQFRPPADAQDTLEFFGNGTPLGDDTDVIIVDPHEHRILGPGGIGEIWTRGPGVTPAYLGDLDRSKELCQATTADGDGPYFRTGDSGTLYEGQVIITGRLKELLIVRGKNHYPADIEATVRALAGDLGLIEVAAFGVKQEDGEEALALAIETTDRDTMMSSGIRTIRQAIAKTHGLAVYRMFVLPPQSLPRTLTNKISRHGCAAMAETPEWLDQEVAQVRQKAREDTTNIDRDLLARRGDELRVALKDLFNELLQSIEGDVDLTTAFQRPVNELGLSSIDTARLVAALRRRTGIEPPIQAFFDGSSLQDVLTIVAQRISGGAEQQSTEILWREDVLPIATALPNRLPARRSRGGAIFLTGATGYLGRWILGELLRKTDRSVICLVRAEDAAAGLARLQHALNDGPGYDEAWTSRLEACTGDLTQPRFGLSDSVWDDLADRTDIIVHNGANVNFVAPYSTLRGTNVQPCQTVAQLAVANDETRTIHLVSTLAVFNALNRREQRRLLESDRLLEPNYIYSGYAQSKWVAETAIRAASTRGVPVMNHRPATIIGATVDGKINDDDFMCRYIKGAIQMGRYPDAHLELDLVPVDWVAEGIAAGVQQGLTNTLVNVHWSAPRPMLLENLMGIFREYGYPLEAQPIAEWLGDIGSSLTPENALYSLQTFLLDRPTPTSETLFELFDGLPLDIDRRNAIAIREAAELPVDFDIDAACRTMATWMQENHFLPQKVAS